MSDEKTQTGEGEGEETEQYEIVQIENLNLTGRYQVMDEPDEEEFGSLKSRIESEGQVDVIIVDEKNNVLDGNTRVPIFRDLGFETVKVYRKTGLSDSEKREVAWGRNMSRRHLDEGEKRDKTKEYLMQDYDPDEETQGDVASTLGVSESTVSRAKKALKRDDDIEKFSVETLSKDERKDKAQEILRENPDASNNSVAEEVGLSHPTVGNVREDMEEDRDNEEEDEDDEKGPRREFTEHIVNAGHLVSELDSEGEVGSAIASVQDLLEKLQAAKQKEEPEQAVQKLPAVADD